MFAEIRFVSSWFDSDLQIRLLNALAKFESVQFKEKIRMNPMRQMLCKIAIAKIADIHKEMKRKNLKNFISWTRIFSLSSKTKIECVYNI